MLYDCGYSWDYYYVNSPQWLAENALRNWRINNDIWQGEFATNGQQVTLNGVSGIDAIVSFVEQPSPINATVVVAVQQASLSPAPTINSSINFNGNDYTITMLMCEHGLYTMWLT